MKVSELLEALKPSQYRPLVKGWDKSRYEAIFKRYASDRNAYRIYIPLKGEAQKVRAPTAIEKAIIDAGYEVEDYASGIASKDGGKRKVKIGRILKDPELLKQFTEDPKRGGAKRSDYTVVISRHPYDIAGMSTDRGWTSCMNLEDGVNKHYVPVDIKQGSIVAYLIKGDDRNISAPTARILIKPFVETHDGSIAFGVQDKVYGTDVAGFSRTVVAWAEEVNDSRKLEGLFVLDDKVYNDDTSSWRKPQLLVGKLYKELQEDPSLLKDMDLPEARLVKIAKLVDGVLPYIKNPSDKVKLAALERNPEVIKDIEDPTEEMQLAVVGRMGFAIKHIENPTKKAQLAAVKYNGFAIQYIKDPTEEVQLAAVRALPAALDMIKRPSAKVKAAAEEAEEAEEARIKAHLDSLKRRR